MKKIWLLLIVLLTIPTFARMLRPGIYSMQDYHYFRLNQFHKCVVDFQIPCRWSPDAGLGYGEPLFNFYGQLPYAVGELIHTTGFSQVDSLKILFIISLTGSGIAMFLLANKMWGNVGSAIIASLFYVYAPYRAVDVWVRGALPEAMSFILFPLIFLSLENFFDRKSIKNATFLGVLLALLILTHNISVILFLPLLGVWTMYRLITEKQKPFKKLSLSLAIAFLLSAFYILPVIFESQFVDIDSTTRGYFNFRAHFTTSSQLLLSNYWGYGGSTFGTEDGLNLSIGYIQWILPIVIGALLFLQRKVMKYKNFLTLFLMGWLFLFLTHERSTPVWVMLQDFIKFVQFPWRFLSVAIFCFSLASGLLPILIKKYAKILIAIIGIIAIASTQSFFREDLWYDLKDTDLTQGPRWEEQTRASIGDYWPKGNGVIPTTYAPSSSKDFELIQKNTNKVVFKTKSNNQNIDFPINDFPGWRKNISGDLVIFTFTNTPIRTIGNLISVLGLVGVLIILLKSKYAYER